MNLTGGHMVHTYINFLLSSSFTTFIICYLFLIPLSGFGKSWTLKESGKTINAKFLSIDSGMVRLRQYSDNEDYCFQVNQFIETDQDYIINLILNHPRALRKNFRHIKKNFDAAIIAAEILPDADNNDLIRSKIKVISVTDNQNLLASDGNNQMIGVRMNTTDIRRGDHFIIVGYLEKKLEYQSTSGETKELAIFKAIPDLTENEFNRHLANRIFLTQLVYYHEPLYAIIK